LEAEKEINLNLEEFLRRKKWELEQSKSNFYRKKNYEVADKAAQEINEKLNIMKGVMEENNKEFGNLEKSQQEKRNKFSLHKAEQRIRLDALNKHLDELEKVLKPQLRLLKKQIEDYNIQIINDKKKVGILSEKLVLTTSQINNSYRREDTQKESSVERVASTENERNQLQVPEISEKMSVSDRSKLPKDDKHSILANPSENGSIPKYGCVNLNLGELNVTGEEQDQISENANKYEEKKIPYSASIIYSSADENSSKYMLNLDKCTVKEANLFENIKGVLEGVSIYKKYKSKSSLKEKIFDPLLAVKYPPEVCGYGKRLLLHNPYTQKLEFHVLKKPYQADFTIPLSEIKKIIIPNETKQIIRVQRQLGILAFENEKSMEMSRMGGDDLSRIAPNDKLDRLSRTIENEQFREQCTSAKYYTFSVLTKDSRIELISDNYTVFKQVINSLNKLLEDLMVTKSLCRELQTIEKTVENDQEKIEEVQN